MRRFSHVGPVALALLLATGCPQAVGAVAPTADCLEAIISDALAGLTVAEIVAKEGTKCAVDASQVVAVLLDPKNTSRVQGAAAYGEAQKIDAMRRGQ